MFEPCPSLRSAAGRWGTLATAVTLVGLFFHWDISTILLWVLIISLPLGGFLIWRAETTRLLIDYNGLDYRQGKRSVLANWSDVEGVTTKENKLKTLVINRANKPKEEIYVQSFETFTNKNYDLQEQINLRVNSAIAAQSATSLWH